MPEVGADKRKRLVLPKVNQAHIFVHPSCYSLTVRLCSPNRYWRLSRARESTKCSCSPRAAFVLFLGPARSYSRAPLGSPASVFQFLVPAPDFFSPRLHACRQP